MLRKKSLSIVVASLAILSVVSTPVFAKSHKPIKGTQTASISADGNKHGAEGMEVTSGTSKDYDFPFSSAIKEFKGKKIGEHQVSEKGIERQSKSPENGTFTDDARFTWRYLVPQPPINSDLLGWKPLPKAVIVKKPPVKIYETFIKEENGQLKWNEAKTDKAKAK